jgi:hypothetical protein
MDVPNFDGKTYKRGRDHERLAGQLSRVRILMADGRWRTLAGISAVVGDPESSVSARLRDLRKKKLGGHIVERRYVTNGPWEYRLLGKETLWPLTGMAENA